MRKPKTRSRPEAAEWTFAEFQRIFGIKLNKFIHRVGPLGIQFNAIAFDDWVKPSENESTLDAVKRRFGKQTVELVVHCNACTY